MPELPEVEVVRRGVMAAAVGRTVRDVVVRTARLRWAVPDDLPVRLAGRALRAAARRGKYLLLEFDTGFLIVHLGMSGSFTTVATAAPLRAHDHFDLVFDDLVVRLNDPRRFGAVLWHPRDAGPIDAHPLLARLGVEPFSDAFSAELLHAATRGRRVSVKQALLAGDIVVGVGNIYASEALFRAGIRPTTPAGRVRLARWRRLVDAVRAVLAEAIEAGGSTLRDFVGADGDAGRYQHGHFVYDRADEPCRVCAAPIRTLRQQGRSTYYCAKCQT